ncbi:MAG: tetratricopeptide repeat protein [Endomicrobiales bacterium]|nr:tetratricopeptide repeat protein [Endomicrobiales bacterium]
MSLSVITFASVIKETEDFYQLLEAGRFDEVKAKIEKVEKPAEKHFWLSRLHFYMADYRSAFSEISEALDCENAEPLWEQIRNYYYFVYNITEDFHEYKSTHFVLRVKGLDVILNSYALNALEKAYEEIGKDLNCFPENRIIVEVYPNKKEFSLASTLSEEILDKTGTVGICKFNRLMIISPQALPLGYSWLDTLAHEYVHFVVNNLSGTKCPLWLHEGIARYHEKRWSSKEPVFLTPAGKNKLKEAQEKNSFISFSRMSPSLVYLDSQDDIMLAFAQVSNCIAYMKKEYNPDIVSKLLKNLDIYEEKTAFKETLGVSWKNFEKKYIKYLKNMKINESPGVIINEVFFEKKSEDEFIGTDLKGYIRLGDKMRQIARFDAALINYNKALKIEPANPVVLLKIARTLIKMEKTEDAEINLKTAIEENPNYVTPYQVLGELYFKNGDYDKSIDIYQKAVAINPFHPQSHRDLARCYLNKKDILNAFEELKITLMLDPDDLETKVMLERLKL